MFFDLIIFQYQRWLYPVDKNRLDDGASEVTSKTDDTTDNEKLVSKKNK